jgi:hypothetical protein
MHSKHHSVIHASLIAAVASAILIVVLTVAGELVAPLKNFLKDAHHHHWIGKGIWAAGLFAVVALIVVVAGKPSDESKLSRSVNILSYTLIATTIILYLFFIWLSTVHH